ncbi:MAG: hypothetical protein ACOX7U_07735 [Desulfitobacteriia bacterium]
MLILGSLAFMMPMFVGIIAVETVPLRLAATAAAILMGVGEIIRATLTPRILGSVADTSGLPVVFIVSSIIMALCGVLSLFLTETLRKDKKDAPSSVTAK